MKVYDNPLYIEDVVFLSDYNVSWDKLKDSSILISGATGMIGSCLIDAIMYRNIKYGMNCHIYALGRNEERAKERFEYCWDDETIHFVPYDINNKLVLDIDKVDFVIHLASNTHPVAYALEPINTITTNIIGAMNMLDFAHQHNAIRVLFASSNEIYGENRGDREFFDEQYCGYIDCNTLRAGYPESKRCGEALCQAYIKEKGMDVVISRFTRSYGPTMLLSDTKAISQFILKGISNKDIVLKSEGNQYYSYTYVVDAVSGLLTVLLKGEKGEAYNISDETSDITLKELASIISDYSNTKVVYEKPDSTECAGYSKVTKGRIDGKKLKGLGWKAQYNIKTGVRRTMDILKQSVE